MIGERIARTIAMSILAIGSLFFLTTHEAQAKITCSTAAFCAGWDAVCKKTGDAAICRDRRAKCLSSGCYFFNSPRPRCKNNPEDLAMTTSCRG